MKLRFLAAWTLLAAAWGPLAPEARAYTFTLQPGLNLVANHQNHTPNNGLNTVLPPASGVPPGTGAYFWDFVAQDFVYADGFDGFTWAANPLLNPGDGAMLQSGSGSPTPVTLTGTAASGSSVALVAGQLHLRGNAVAGAATAPGSFADLVGGPPAASGTSWLFRWDALNATYLPHRYVGGTWTPAAPSVPVGESAFVGWFPAGLPAPNIVGGRRGCDTGGEFIRVAFDREVDPLLAAQPANYTITGGAVTLGPVELEYDRSMGWMPVPRVRAVRLRVVGTLPAPAALTVQAPGVTGMSGTPVNPASSASFQTALVALSATFDCDRGLLCITFNQPVDPAVVFNLANYSVSWVDLITSASGTLTPASVGVGGPGPGGSNELAQICLTFASIPTGNLLFTVNITGLFGLCGGAPQLAPVLSLSLQCNPAVQGRVFRHQTAPVCVQDTSTSLYGTIPNEYGLPGFTVQLASGTATYWAGTAANGSFRVNAPPGTYTLSVVLPSNWAQNCPVSGGYPLTIVAPNVYSGYRFALSPITPIHDLTVALWDRLPIDPVSGRRFATPCCGFPMTLVAHYRNAGTEVILGATVTLTLSPNAAPVFAALQTTASSPPLPPPSVAGNVLTWTLPALPPGGSGTVEATVMLNCTLGSLQTIVGSAAITVPPGDPTPGNNTAAYSRPTTCSYDPNDKTVEPPGCGPEGYVPMGTELTYLIRFQNTGSGPAWRVIIRDFLDPALDLGSVTFLGMSHVGYTTVDPVTREIVWTMDDINLPGAAYDEPNSHGWVRFKVLPVSGMSSGTVATNAAAIYFDLNPPIDTGTTTNTFTATPTPVAAFTASTLTPNLQQPVDFTSTGGTVGATFEWDFGPGAIPATSTAQNPIGVRYTTPGVKVPVLRVKLGGCESRPASLRLEVRGFSYDISPVPQAYNLIANQLDDGQGNFLDGVLPGAAVGAALFKWNNAAQTWEIAAKEPAGWQPGTVTLAPGEGAFYYSPAAETLTFRGAVRTPVLPITLTPGRSYLLSRQVPLPARYEDIVGASPTDGTVVYQWDAISQTYFVSTYDLGFWDNEPNVAVGESAWILPGGGQPPPLPTDPPMISRQPASAVVTLAGCGSNCVTFGVQATGTPPLSYQWLLNGAPIAGATGPTYTRCGLTAADNGGQYTVQVTNPYGQATSSAATLIVVPDTTPPTLLLALCRLTPERVLVVSFDECLESASASEPFNYTINNGTVQVLSAMLGPDGTTVLLTLDPNTPLLEGVANTLVVDGVQDLAGNTLVAGAAGSSITFICLLPPCLQPLPPGLVAWWPLDEVANAPAYADLSGNGNTAFVQSGGPLGSAGSPTPAAGIVAGASFFVDYAARGRVQNAPSLNFAPPNGNGSFSVDCWFKHGGFLPPWTPWNPIVDKLVGLTGYTVGVNGSGNVVLKVGDGAVVFTLTGPTVPGGGVWTFVGVAVNRGSSPPVVTFYVNNTATTLLLPPAFTGSTANTGDLYVGGTAYLPNTISEFFLDEVELFNRALSPGEMASIWAAGSSGKCKPPCPRPANDLCVNAIPIPPALPTSSVCGSTRCATPSAAGSIPPPCGPYVNNPWDAPDGWYTYTPSCSGAVTFDTCGIPFGCPDTSIMDTVLSVYTGTCPNLTQVGCNDNAGGSCGLRSRVTINATAGTTYHIRVAGAYTAIGGFLLTVTGGATPPANDLCANAIPLAAGSPAACGTTVCATPSTAGSLTPAPCGASVNSPDVWYTFRPVCNGQVTADTCGLCPGQASLFDTVVSVYTGTCPNLTQVSGACNDDAVCGNAWTLQSSVTFNALANATYYIRVSGFNGAAGPFRLNINATSVPPGNDLCANATPVNLGSPAACGDTRCATPSAPGSIPTPCVPSINSPDVWYRFTPACAGPVTIDTCGLCPGQASTFDTVLSVYYGPCSSLTQITCNDDAGGACGLQSRVTFNATAGVTYFIRVGGFVTGAGPFRLNVSQALTPPPHDLCANATPVGNGTYSYNICGANTDGPAGPCPTANSDVWFRYTAPCSGQMWLDTCGSGFDTVLYVYSGACNNLAFVTCNDDAGANGRCPNSLNSYVTFNVTGGQTYYFRVGGYGLSLGWGLLTVNGPYPALGTCPPPTGPYYCRLFRVLGNGTGAPWSWSLGVPCCREIGNANVPGVVGNANALAAAFANSINNACPGGGVLATPIPLAFFPGLMMVCVSSCTPTPTPFVFRVGPPGATPQSQCVVAGSWLPTLGYCSFNPETVELPLAGHDLNNNGIDDAIDITAGTSDDSNGNGIPDEAEDCLPPQLAGKAEPQVVQTGNTVALSVDATGTAPLSYQWSRAGVPLTDNGRIAGSRSNVLTIQGLTDGDLGDYSVTVSNACGVLTTVPVSVSTEGPPPPVITHSELVSGNFLLSCEAKQGQTYVVEYKNSLDDASWTPLETVPGDGFVHTVTDPGPLPSPSRFYRVRQQ